MNKYLKQKSKKKLNNQNFASSDKFAVLNRIKSFTLVELLIIVAITVILSSFGIMNLIGNRNERDLNYTAQEIITVLRNAQDRSISQEQGDCWGVFFNNPAIGVNSYELFKGLVYASSSVVSKTILRSNIKFNNPKARSSSTIIFAPITGLPAPNTSTIISVYLIDTNSSSSIIVNSNGEISF